MIGRHGETRDKIRVELPVAAITNERVQGSFDTRATPFRSFCAAQDDKAEAMQEPDTFNVVIQRPRWRELQ